MSEAIDTNLVQELRQAVQSGELERMTEQERRDAMLKILDVTEEAVNRAESMRIKAERADANSREAERRTNSGLANAHLQLMQTERNVQRVADKVRRNDPCTCGSGRKAKHCCGAD